VVLTLPRWEHTRHQKAVLQFPLLLIGFSTASGSRVDSTAPTSDTCQISVDLMGRFCSCGSRQGREKLYFGVPCLLLGVLQASSLETTQLAAVSKFSSLDVTM